MVNIIALNFLKKKRKETANYWRQKCSHSDFFFHLGFRNSVKVAYKNDHITHACTHPFAYNYFWMLLRLLGYFLNRLERQDLVLFTF
jgi:hypothetical protein